jgi:hypothetical protein
MHALANALLLLLCTVCVVFYVRQPRQSGLRQALLQEVPQPPGRCRLSDFTTGAWLSRPTAQLPDVVAAGYSFCSIDRRQDGRAGYGPEDVPPYLKHVWVPSRPDCALPRRSAAAIKACLTNTTLAFMGDSLARNQQQSLQCTLLEEPEGARAFVDGYKLSYSSFYPEMGTGVRHILSVHLDKVDLVGVDVLVVSTGPWWRPVHFPRFGGEAAGLTWLTDWVNVLPSQDEAAAFIDEEVRKRVDLLLAAPSSTRIIWRLPDIVHERVLDGAGITRACLSGLSLALPEAQWLYDSVMRHATGTRIELMDVTALSLARPDAHLYLDAEGRAMGDCMHWALPGVPDTWNAILLAHLCGHDAA